MNEEIKTIIKTVTHVLFCLLMIAVYILIANLIKKLEPSKNILLLSEATLIGGLGFLSTLLFACCFICFIRYGKSIYRFLFVISMIISSILMLCFSLICSINICINVNQNTIELIKDNMFLFAFMSSGPFIAPFSLHFYLKVIGNPNSKLALISPILSLMISYLIGLLLVLLGSFIWLILLKWLPLIYSSLNLLMVFQLYKIIALGVNNQLLKHQNDRYIEDDINHSYD